MNPTPNIVLTGFMGTGKSTVGRILAHDLGLEFVDTDDVIEERHGTIAAIFSEQGEPAFRAIERDLARELAQLEGAVISTGGKMLLDPINEEALIRTGLVYCLVASPEEIHDRIRRDAGRIERPLLDAPNPRQRIADLLAERAEGYRRFEQVETSGRTPTEIASVIAERIAARRR